MHTNDVTNKRVYYVPAEAWDGEDFLQERDLTGDLYENQSGVKCFMHGYLHKGDYADTGFVGQSNVKIFEEEFSDHPDVRFFHSMYSFTGVLIREGTEDERILEILERLENYSVVDEDHLSFLEADAQGDAWEDFIKRDFERALEKALGFDDISEHLDSTGVERLFDALCERTNRYIEPDGNSMWINVETLVKECSLDDIEWAKTAC